ncbi:hypothetical protein [Pelotomaculum propionicicum]|nr:hypothetical protein [Pelotomaculum propionicicum]
MRGDKNMDEQKWAERFSREVDGILQGAEPAPAGPAPEEYRKAVDMAKELAGTDFNDECRGRQGLRIRLLDMFAARRAEHAGEIEGYGTELDDEELKNVAGGTENSRKDSCSLCDCGLSFQTITGGTCPFCGRLRERHPS